MEEIRTIFFLVQVQALQREGDKKSLPAEKKFSYLWKMFRSPLPSSHGQLSTVPKSPSQFTLLSAEHIKPSEQALLPVIVEVNAKARSSM